MKYLQTIFILLAAAGVSVLAQAPPPPPAPAIYSPPPASELREFNSPEDGFSATFAGIPQADSSVDDGTTIKTYTTSRVGTDSMVRIYIFPFDAETDLDSKVFFNSVKDIYVSELNGRVESMKEIEVAGRKAMELHVTDGMQYLITRLIIGNHRVYEQVIDVTNWHIISEQKKAEFKLEAQRFFDSFAIRPLEIKVLKAAPRIEGVTKLESVRPETITERPDGWFDYSFMNGGFQVSFPARAEKEVEPVKLGDITPNMYTYTAETDTRIFLFGFLDMQTPMTDPAELEALYDGWTEGAVEGMDGIKVEKKTIEFFGQPARHLRYFDETIKGESIGVYKDGKMFQIIFMELKGLGGTEEEGRTLRDKFFNSFLYRENKVVPKPEPTGARVYLSEQFGFRLELPEGWNEIPVAQTKMIAEDARENMPDVNDKGRAELEDSIRRTDFLFSFSKMKVGAPNNPSIMAAVERFPTSVADTRMLARATEIGFRDDMGFDIDKPAERTTIGGREFYIVHLSKTVDTVTVRQRIYLRKIGPKAVLQFGLSYFSDEDLQVLEKSLQSLQFTK